MNKSTIDKAMDYIQQNAIIVMSFTMPSLMFLYLLTEIKLFLYLLAPVSILWGVSCIYNEVKTKKGIIINTILLTIILGYRIAGKSIFSNPLLLIALLLILIAINLYDIVKKEKPKSE